MVKRIDFLGDNWKDVLRDEFGEENILEYWGGSKTSSTSTGAIRMGGDIPIDFL